jgi:hypothetical protein
MGITNILDCVRALKVSNSEGYNRLFRRIIQNGINLLMDPMTVLLKFIYESKVILWKIAKVSPIPKKAQSLTCLIIDQFQTCAVHQIFLKILF